VSILAHAQTIIANLDSEIADLGANLAALQDFARSLPAGVTISLGERVTFDGLSDQVNAQFEDIAERLETAGVPVESVIV